MSEAATTHLPDDNTPPDQSAPPKSIPEIVQDFRLAVELMSEQLEYAQESDADRNLKELGEEDLRGFLRDMIDFSAYVKKWQKEKIDVSGNIKSLVGVRKTLQQAGRELNTALSMNAALKDNKIDMVQRDKGMEAYYKRLANCSNLLSEVLEIIS